MSFLLRGYLSVPTPDDDRFLECALVARAAFLVTGSLRPFPKHYDPVAIVTPGQLLQRLIVDQG